MPVEAQAAFRVRKRKLASLVREHLALKDEPLLLAAYYVPRRKPKDIFVFELIENFGDNTVSPAREFFEVTFSSSKDIPLEPGQQVHLVMTNPEEMEVALQEGWKNAQELKEAKRKGKFWVLHQDARAFDVLGKIAA
ncbi:MAG: hypothetical protein NTW86_18940 [Candidatus Sumerlaeota bacterium]|nr:hypothetical protein [Candidatus Sumerlaeota bacterium]